MEYNRPYRCYNQCFSRPELEIGSRLEVVVIGKNWDNYIIKSSQNGADYFGVIYLGRWVREPQPPYSSRVPDFQQRNIFGTYSNGVVPYSSTNKVARQKEMIESQQQRFGELSNGCEKQTINHVAPQTSIFPTAPTSQMSVLKKNKRKAYVPREVPSSFTATPSSSCQSDQGNDYSKIIHSQFHDFFTLTNGSHEITGNDDFTQMLMRYVLKDEKGVGCNVASDSSVNSDHLTLDECLRLDQARKMATMQKKNTVKRKDSPSLETQQNTQTCLDSKINGFFNNISAKSGTKMPLTQSSGEGMEFHAPGITPLAPAVGTANFVNVIPLNIPTENQATEEEESVLSNTSVVATSETVSPLFTAASSSVAATNTPTTAAASPTSTSVSVATSTPSRAITPLPSQGSTVASSSTPKPDTKSSSLSGHPSSNATPAVTLNASNSNNSSSTLPIANVADAHTTASDALPSSTASNSSPSSPSSVPEVPETETSTSSAAEIGNKDSKQSKPELMSQSGAEQLATLLGCSSLAAKARRTVTDDSSKVVSKPESTSDTTETSTTLQPTADEKEDINKNEVASNAVKNESCQNKKSNSNRKIVVKISLGNFPHSTMETKSSPITSTAGSGRRSVADLRCPPEIAKSFEEPDIVRRSDTGCPPMVPRTTSGYDDVGTNVVIEEKEKKKRKTSAKKKKAEVADEVSDEKSLEVATTVISEPSSDAPTAEENPFSLSSGDIVWAKNGSEPFWPGELFQFTRVNDVAGAVITWFGVDTFTPFVPLSKIEPFALKYSQRFNPKRNDRKYQKGVARGIYRCKPRSGYFENNLTKCIHEVLVNSYHFVLEPFEGSKKRKRKSTGFPVKKRRTAPSANHNAHLDTQSDEIAQPQEDEDHFDDDESLSVEDSSCVPEAEGECEHVDASSSEKNALVLK